MQPALPPSSHLVSDAVTIRGLRGSPVSGALGGSVGDVNSGCGSNSGTRPISPCQGSSQNPSGEDAPTEDPPVICKLAERVRLKKVRT